MRHSIKNLFFMFFVLLGTANADLVYTYRFSRDDVQFSKKNVYDVVGMRGCLDVARPLGAPMLPVKTLSFLIPKNVTVKAVEVLSSTRVEILGSYNILPIQFPKPMDAPEPQFIRPDMRWYHSKSKYPSNMVVKTTESYRSGFKIVTVGLNPVSYIPQQKKLSLYTSISFALRFAPVVDSSTQCHRRSPQSQKAVEDVVKCYVSAKTERFVVFA